MDTTSTLSLFDIAVTLTPATIADAIINILKQQGQDISAIEIKQSSDPKKLSIHIKDNACIAIYVGPKSAHIDLYINRVKPTVYENVPYKKVMKPDNMLWIYIDRIEDIIGIGELLACVYDVQKWNAEPISCCSLYVQCSDAKECLRRGIRDYENCAYRRALEKGIIYYGINMNVE